MFKKDRDLTERSRTLLKNKEIRNLRTEIKKQFPLVDEEVLSTVIPNKADVTCVKLANRTILYEIDHVTLFFDLEGRNNLFPTVHTLWKMPDMMRTFHTHGPVSRFILNGADFMSPGVATYDGLTGLKEHEKCCVKIIGNPLPFAVGESLQSLASLIDRKGKAVGILHVYGDLLANKAGPNEGFSFKQISPLGGNVEEDDDDEEDQDEDGVADGENHAEETETKRSIGDIPVIGQSEEVATEAEELPLENLSLHETADPEEQPEELEHERTAGANEEDDGEDKDEDNREEEEEDQEEEEEVVVSAALVTASKHKKKGGKNKAVPTSTPRETVPIDIPANDTLLLRYFVLVCKYLVKDQHLPILASALWTLVQKVGQLEGQVVDIKHTSHKKVISFLHTLNIRYPGFLTSNEPAPGVISITKISRTHPILRDYKIEQVDDWKAQLNALMTASDSTTTASSSAASQHQAASGIQVHELFKLPKKIRELFTDSMPLRGEYGEYLKAKEVKELVSQFVAQEGLSMAEKKSHVSIPVTCGLHALFAKEVLTHQPTAASTSSASATPSTTQPSKASSNPLLPPDRDHSIPVPDNKSNDYDAEDAAAASYVPAFGLPPAPSSSQLSSTNAPPIGLKIASSGLKNIDEMSDAELAEYKASYAKKLAALHPEKFASQAKGSKLTASAWQANTAEAWKPISLPSSSAASSSSSANKGPTKAATSSATTAKKSTASSVSFHTDAVVGSKKKDKETVEVVPVDYNVPLCLSKEELMKLFLTKLTPYHGIVSSLSGEAQVHIASGTVPKIKLLAEQRMGNKMVSIVRGLQHYFASGSSDELSAIAKMLQKRFACSVSVSSVPGIPKEKEILLQGNYVHELEEALVQVYGFPKTVFEVSLGKGVKPKKK